MRKPRKKKLPTAVIGKKSSAKVRGATRRKKNTVPQKNTPMNKVANKTRKSSAVASVGTFQPAKMSPVKSTKKAVDVRKASSFDKKYKKRPKKRVVRKPR